MLRNPVFTRVVVLSLCLNFTGVLPVLAQSSSSASSGQDSSVPQQQLPDSGLGDGYDEEVPSNLRALLETGDDLETQIQLLVRRAKHPGTPGTPPGIPTAQDVAQLEGSFGRWKNELERSLALPNTPTQQAGEYIPVDAKLRVLNTYFNQLTQLTALRLTLRMDYGTSWRDQYKLQIPRAIMNDFPGLGASTVSRTGERFFPLVIDRGADGRADPVTLRVSETLVQGLEIGRLTDNPTNDNFFTMVQYLSVRQLLQNLAELRYLKSSRSVDIPAIPSALTSRLRTMGVASDMIEEQRRATAEPGARDALRATYASAERGFGAFITPEFTRALLAIMIPDAPAPRPAPRRSRGAAPAVPAAEQARRDAYDPMYESLTSAERELSPSTIDQEIQASSLSLSALPEIEAVPTLKYFVTNSRGNALLTKLLSMMEEGIVSLSLEQRQKVMDLIEARKKAYGDSIAESALRGWLASARRQSEDQLYTYRRAQFVESLLFEARNVARNVRESFAGDQVDMPILVRSFSDELAKMSLRASARDWMVEIARQNDYVAARDKYAQIISRATSPRVLNQGLVNPATVERYLETHDFKPEVEFSRQVNQVLAQQLIQRVVDGRKKDIRDLLKLGDLLGFNRVYTKPYPSVRDVLSHGINGVARSSSDLDDRMKKYLDTVETDVLSRYPVLAAEVGATTSSGGAASSRLYDALIAIAPQAESNPRYVTAAGPLVDQALAVIEARIRGNITKVATARDLGDIEKVVTSSMMLELVMRGAPEFKLQQDQFVEELLVPSFTHQLMHKYVGNYLSYGFGALMLMHATKWAFKRTGPYVDAITMALEPLIKGYMATATILIIADTAYQYQELARMRENRQQVEDFYFSAAEGRAFFDYGELQGANSAYQLTKWFFVGRVAMDVAFMYLPMARQGLGKVLSKITVREFQADVNAFKLLGLKPGEWDLIDRQIRVFRENPHLLEPGWAEEAEAAYSRLARKVRAGKTWDLDISQDVAAFKTLGIEPGDWDALSGARERIAEEAKIFKGGRKFKQKAIDDFLDRVSAFARLSRKVRSGRAWTGADVDVRAFERLYSRTDRLLRRMFMNGRGRALRDSSRQELQQLQPAVYAQLETETKNLLDASDATQIEAALEALKHLLGEVR